MDGSDKRFPWYMFGRSLALFVGFVWVVSYAACESPPPSETPSAEPSPTDASVFADDKAPERDPIISKAASVAISDVQKVVPNPAFPPEVTTQPANNNLDVIEFEGRLYLSFRTAPSHFASDAVEMYIVSTTDQKTWDFETKIALKSDVREPRFFAWKGKLSMYFAKLGTDPDAFEPGSTWVVRYNKKGDWTAPKELYTDGFIPWRIKIFDDKPVMIGYTGGENIYKFTGEKLKVYLRTTTDGINWIPLNPEKPVVLEGGSSETDIAFGGDGALYAVARNEAGDEDGFGSKICRAPKDDWTNWTCQTDKKKYDSPLLFSYKGEVYLVGRRNVSDTGNYDLELNDQDLTHAQKLAKYQLDYWSKPKRCSIWLVRRETLTVELIKDLPSKGDTCFPSIIERENGSFQLFNYSSDIDGEDRIWLSGQTNPTFIYSMMLQLTP